MGFYDFFVYISINFEAQDFQSAYYEKNVRS